ncbi:hypothetical protein ACFPOB_20525 [Bosea eneae]|uniref:Uncharacterized protein n=1 Tax=Bosea eneae TaxID=151454 RepID=A0ABW0IUF4_9HYPH
MTMKTVAIVETFDGYPDGPDGQKRRFVAGETPSLDPDYADLLIAKGLAAELPPQHEAPRARKEKQS